MNVSALLELIPEELLDFLSVETSVDHQVKKLTGLTTFKLILFSMLNSEKVSLRVMESFLSSAQFRSLAGVKNITARHGSIRDRICSINPDYFERIFQHVFQTNNELLGEQNALVKADSTYVGISAKLVNWSMKNGSHEGTLKHLKYSISVKGSLPCHVQVYTERQFISEDLALVETVLKTLPIKESIVTFDRGIQSRKAFDKFSENDLLFVGRIKPGCKCRYAEISSIPEKPTDATITILEDKKVFLAGTGKKWTKIKYRLVTVTIDKSGEEICFVTNCFDLSVYEIAAIYKQRWEIEVFFKFLKQHLNLSHFVSRNDNAIKVMIYMTLITAALILTYKKLNQIKGYKIAKLRFEIELDNLLIKEIVILCGGNPNKAQYLWNSS